MYTRSGRRADAVDQLLQIQENDNVYTQARKFLITELFHYQIKYFATTDEEYVFESIIKKHNIRTRLGIFLGILRNDSDHLGKQANLWQLGLADKILTEYKNQGMDIDADKILLSLGVKNSNINAARRFYNYIYQERGWSKDIPTGDFVDYNNGEQNIEKFDPTDRSVIWIIKGCEKIPIAIPRPGWVSWARIEHYGQNEYLLYRPETGAAIKVKNSMQEAIADFETIGIPRSVAEEVVSRWFSKQEGEGNAAAVTRVVGRGFYPFDVGVGCGPESGSWLSPYDG